jgi:predicted  nucleic acid-binding Zn-ribbon protein
MPARKKVEDIENEISSIERRLKTIESLIADPEHYNDSGRVIETSRENRELRERISLLTHEWEKASLKVEELSEELRRKLEAL